MAKVIMLGTGSGGTIELYNTCFIIQNKLGSFLVDTGGSIEIIKRLKQSNIDLRDIKNIFISHSHTDHVLGLIWMFKKMSTMIIHGEIKEKINIYCNSVVYETIKGVASYVLPPKLMEAVYSIINFVILNDRDMHVINGINYEFFDIMAKGTMQYGFECNIEGNWFIFLGDENMNPLLNSRVARADYIMHEAFCLDSEETKFHAYEKNHSTALSAARKLSELEVKNIILYHTEETHGNKRKELYTKEAREVFKGNIIVPNDLEVIEIVRKLTK